VSEWNDMSTQANLAKRVGLVQSEPHHDLFENKLVHVLENKP
jgi:hypothetical protein